MADRTVAETTLVAICAWCMADVPVPPGVYMDGDHIEPFLCSDCGEPIAARVSICTYPAGVARLVERAMESGSWVTE